MSKCLHDGILNNGGCFECRAKLTPELTEQELIRIRDGVEGFLYYCRMYVQIEDKDTHKAIPFILFPDQEDVIRGVFKGEWPCILKARRIGMTWLFAVYALWLTTFFRMRAVVVLNQDKEYANDFLERVKFIYEHLPTQLQPAITTDQRSRLGFNKNGHGSYIRSIASTKRSARSISGDLIIFDEIAYQKYAQKAVNAAKPAVEIGGGTIVALSTSDGPSGFFYETFLRAINASPEQPSKFTAKFYSWKGRPGRTQEWYDKEKAENAADPLYMNQEYPETWEEAFNSAEGRVYPYFKNSLPFVCTQKLEPTRKRYRAVDWGGTDAFVCLWGEVIPGESKLTVDPSCKNLITEMLAYTRDEVTKRPKDMDNHAPDALRYMVVSGGKDGLRGHLHIYRELYIKNSAAKGLSLVDLAGRIKVLSGNEFYEQSVADRSRPDSIVLFNQLGVSIRRARALKSVGSKTEIEQGIIRVNTLVMNTTDGKRAMQNPSWAPMVVHQDITAMNEVVYKRGSPFA